MNDKIRAPFTEEQVAALNRWQTSLWVHPFTCGSQKHTTESLIAAPSGWYCPRCDYTQDWAHDMMVEDIPGHAIFHPMD